VVNPHLHGGVLTSLHNSPGAKAFGFWISDTALEITPRSEGAVASRDAAKDCPSRDSIVLANDRPPAIPEMGNAIRLKNPTLIAIGRRDRFDIVRKLAKESPLVQGAVRW
jgi:hypothetical protein